ncbi:hypothetical protein NL676_019219 [Syzygium grande]|nr:hypothetical protein NL676_019219 [Syzygium grande]
MLDSKNNQARGARNYAEDNAGEEQGPFATGKFTREPPVMCLSRCIWVSFGEFENPFDMSVRLWIANSKSGTRASPVLPAENWFGFEAVADDDS